MTFTKTMAAVGLTLVLAACGSSVKLDSAAVEDRTRSAADAMGARSAVARVDAGSSSASPVNAAMASRLVYFDYDSYAIKPEYQSVIEGNAKLLKASKSRKATLEGHTDERGGREYNLALGQKRAEAVRRALGLLGVSDNQIEAVSFGKEKPAASGNDETAWASNRRVEISYR